jgi:hypothetical protein
MSGSHGLLFAGRPIYCPAGGRLTWTKVRLKPLVLISLWVLLLTSCQPPVSTIQLDMTQTLAAPATLTILSTNTFTQTPTFTLTATATTRPTSKPTRTLTPTIVWEKSCDDWAELRCGEIIVSNNVWGKGDVTNATQCVSAREANGKCQFKWEWVWPDSGSGAVRAYPEIIYGWKPWASASTTDKLPVKIRDITAINLDLDVFVRADGACNTAFDLWLTASPTPRPGNITHELMIWLSNVGWDPGSGNIDTVEIEGVDYKLYKAPMQTWTYISFARVLPRTSGRLNIAAFLQYLVEHHYISSSEYLASIEFGNEIIVGKGATYVNQFDMQIP